MNKYHNTNQVPLDSSGRVHIRHKTRKRLFSRTTLFLLHIATAVCLIYAWYPAVSNIVSNILWPPVERGERTADSFIALAYDNLSWSREGNPESILRDHVRVLKANGYVPITLADVHGLMYDGKPVPQNSILLTFDKCSRTFCSEIKSALRHHGWHGVAFLCTNDRTDAPRSFRDWDKFVNLARSRHWDVGAQSHDGYLPAPGQEYENDSSHFLTTYAWLPRKRRFETVDEFRRRLTLDHNRCSETFFRRTSIRPTAYAYPYGDFGQFATDSPQIKRINEELVSKNYEIAFLSGGLAFNTAFSNPHRLNRLRVNSGWSGRDLIAHIRNTIGRAAIIQTKDNITRKAAWILESGDIKHGRDGLVMEAPAEAKVATAWLAGSDQLDEFNTSLSIDVVGGEFNLFLMQSFNPSAYVRFGISANGEAILEQKKPLQDTETLAEAQVSLVSSNRNQLQIFLRGNRVFTRFNGKTVFERGVERDLSIPAGMIGIGLRRSGSSHCMAVLRDIEFKNQKPRLATWNNIEMADSYVISWLHENAGQLTDLAPPLPSHAEAAKHKEKMSRYKILANTYGLRLIPKVSIEERSPLISWSPSRIADELVVSGHDGLFLDIESCSNLSMEETVMWLKETGRYLRRMSRTILIKLPPSLENATGIRSVIDDYVSLSLVTRDNLRLLNEPGENTLIKEERIPDLPSDYQPPQAEHLAMESIPSFLSNEEERGQLEKLQYLGESALNRHDYEHAIIVLSKWHERDPENSRPLTLIGDAFYAAGFRDEALDFYRESLDVNPGQVRLAAKLADALAKQSRDEEARNLLNLYVRLFPDDVEILRAQAIWLLQHERYNEAQTRIERILQTQPYDFRALVLMLRTASNKEKRHNTITKLHILGQKKAYQLSLVKAIKDYDLLTLPNTDIFIDLLKEIDNNTNDPDVKSAIADLNFRSEPIHESLASETLSTEWTIDGAIVTKIPDGVVMAVTPTRSECMLRLNRTDRWRDCYVKATVEDPTGGFWIYARHSMEGLIRFGFDSGSDELFVQVWKGRQRRIVVNEHKPMLSKSGPLQMSMEVKGNGVLAYINNKPIFSTPIEIPDDIGHGWIAISARNVEIGKASVKIMNLEAGPLPIRLALLPQTPSTSRVDEELARMRSLLGTVSDYSPDWFSVSPSGSWSSSLEAADDFFRLFARYYRIRLLPTVNVPEGVSIAGADILEIIDIHKLDGVVLRYTAMPNEEWILELERELDGHPICVFILAPGRAGSRKAKLRGIGHGKILLNDSRETVTATILKARDYPEVRTDNDFKKSPAVIILDHKSDDGQNEPEVPAGMSIGENNVPALNTDDAFVLNY